MEMANEGGKPEQVIGKSEIVKQTYETYVDDGKRKIATSLELPLKVIVLAELLQNEVQKHPHWDCRRTPHALFVDCIYIVSKKVGVKVTSRGIATKTKEALGIGTQPRPREWSSQFQELIDKVLG
jgi:transcription initiation factor TFIIIB Brf1 subunit/transcription initiation factor TFIIB|tara:strand:- start:160 stop:534 length:375 start_codon:yes stop_codon:yes gene_type:complete